jgi:hypothetical protein
VSHLLNFSFIILFKNIKINKIFFFSSLNFIFSFLINYVITYFECIETIEIVCLLGFCFFFFSLSNTYQLQMNHDQTISLSNICIIDSIQFKRIYIRILVINTHYQLNTLNIILVFSRLNHL